MLYKLGDVLDALVGVQVFEVEPPKMGASIHYGLWEVAVVPEFR